MDAPGILDGIASGCVDGARCSVDGDILWQSGGGGWECWRARARARARGRGGAHLHVLSHCQRPACERGRNGGYQAADAAKPLIDVARLGHAPPKGRRPLNNVELGCGPLDEMNLLLPRDWVQIDQALEHHRRVCAIDRADQSAPCHFPASRASPGGVAQHSSLG